MAALAIGGVVLGVALLKKPAEPEQDPELIARCSPIRRQLLGALATNGHPLGEEPEFHPSSQYWLTKNQDDVPLRAWAEAQASAEPQVKEHA